MSLTEGEMPSPTHPSAQMGYAFQYLHDDDAPVKGAFKMRNPWNIKTPPIFNVLLRPIFISKQILCNMARCNRYRYL